MDELVTVVYIAGIGWTLTVITRAVIEHRERMKLLDAKVDPDLVMSPQPAPERGLGGTLKWGIVLTAVAIAIILVGVLDLDKSPLSVGITLLGAGLGLLIYYGLAKPRIDERDRS